MKHPKMHYEHTHVLDYVTASRLLCKYCDSDRVASAIAYALSYPCHASVLMEVPATRGREHRGAPCEVLEELLPRGAYAAGTHSAAVLTTLVRRGERA